MNSYRAGQILLICLSVLSAQTLASPIKVYSVDSLGYFVVEGNFIDSKKTNRIVISNALDSADYELSASIMRKASDLEGGVDRAPELGVTALKELFLNGLFISYQGKQIIPATVLPYDHIRFSMVCIGPNQRHRLLFSLIVGGTANGNVADMLFVYYDLANKTFKYKIIEERYLTPLCNMEGASENKQKEEEKISALNLIYQQLDIPGQAPDLEELIETGHSIPTRQLSHATLERLLDEARYLVPEVEQIDNQETFEREDYFQSKIVFNELAESDRWKVVEFMYLQLWSSWGVLLVQDKSTDQWTSFYTSSAGDSNALLYLDNQVELIGDSIRGKFNPYAQNRVEISLSDFSVKRTHPYSFSEYFVDVYLGPIEKLDTKSSEFASIFPTRIRKQLKEGVNFAGHYSVMRAGCGTQCQMIAITDVITGNVVAELSGRSGAEFMPDSELFILDTSQYCIYMSSCKPSYYQMVKGQMILLDEYEY